MDGFMVLVKTAFYVAAFGIFTDWCFYRGSPLYFKFRHRFFR